MNNEEQKQSLQKAIDHPIAFFELFNFPLTSWEIWRYSSFCKNFSEFHEILLDNNNSRQDFLFFKQQMQNIDIRKKRYNYADIKFKKAMRITKIFRFIPWIKGVAIGNMIGSHNLKEKGDIDFFIVTAHNRIWISRFVCVMIAKFLRMRPSPGKTKDKICLSFFVSEKKLNLQDFMLSRDDFYFIYWLTGLFPIYGKVCFWDDFYKANDWIENYLPNWRPNLFSHRRQVKSIGILKIFRRSGGFSNKILKKIQLGLLPEDLKELMNKDTRVIINDRVLKMHFNDRREEYNKKYLKLIS